MTDIAPLILTAALLLITLAAGFVVGTMVGQHRGRLAARQDIVAAEERLTGARAEFQSERSSLREQLAELSGQVRASQQTYEQTKGDLEWQREHNGELEKKMAPMREAFDQLSRQVREAEKTRIQAESELGQKVATMAKEFGEASRNVQAEARKLSTVLSRTEKRGAWGEMQLRGLIEASGMLRHVHYVEQDHTRSESGAALRPDVIIDLAGGRKVIVDSKVPLDAFLRLAGDDTGSADDALAEHGRLVHQHIQSLSAKEYWRRYDSPEFVIMFLPSEGLLSAALEARPDLIQHGLDKKVFLATPTTLLAMLHTITHSWRQVEAAEQAREIQAVGAELYERLTTMATRLDGVGRAIGRSVTEYNKLVGTVETRVLVSGRKMANLSVADSPLPDVDRVTETPRDLKPGAWPDHTSEELAAIAAAPDLVDPQTESHPASSTRKQDTSAA
jgi:DNA recombination protein RmuC